jgi:hypothetical protein
VQLESQEKFQAAIDKLDEIRKYDKKYWPADLDLRISKLRAKLQAMGFFFPEGTRTATASTAQPSATPPAAPAVVSPGAASEPGPVISTLTPTLRWTAVPGAVSYAVGISKYPYGSANLVWNPQIVKGTSIQVPGGVLQPGTKYRWNMQARSAAGQLSPLSAALYFQTTVPPTAAPAASAAVPTQAPPAQPPAVTTAPSAPPPPPSPTGAPSAPAPQTPTVPTLKLYVHSGSATGPVLSGVRVAGKDGAGKAFNLTTDTSGCVTIAGAPGTWQLALSMNGYQGLAGTVAITASGTAHLVLRPLPRTLRPPAQPAEAAEISPKPAAMGTDKMVATESKPGWYYIELMHNYLEKCKAQGRECSLPKALEEADPHVVERNKRHPTYGCITTQQFGDASKQCKAFVRYVLDSAGLADVPNDNDVLDPWRGPWKCVAYKNADAVLRYAQPGDVFWADSGKGWGHWGFIWKNNGTAIIVFDANREQYPAKRGLLGEMQLTRESKLNGQPALASMVVYRQAGLSGATNQPSTIGEPSLNSDAGRVLAEIQRRARSLPAYPQYLHGTNMGLRGAIADAAVQVANRQRLDEYDRWYQAALNYRGLAQVQLIRAERFARTGKVEEAQRFLQDSDRCLKLYYLANDAAISVYEAGVEKAAYYARAVYETSRAAFVLTSSAAGLGPVASVLADHLYTATDFVVNTSEMGLSKAAKQAVIDVIAQEVGKEMVKEIAGTGLKGAQGAKPATALKDLVTRLARDRSFCGRVAKAVAQGTSQEISTDLVSKLMSDVAAQSFSNP